MIVDVSSADSNMRIVSSGTRSDNSVEGVAGIFESRRSRASEVLADW